MSAGIAQENGSAQNITFPVEVGEVFVAPQGLLHFNHNQECHANAFFQSFNSNDPGAVNVINALANLGMANADGAAAIKASTAEGVMVSAPPPDMKPSAFGLDKHCLMRCNLPDTGAPGDGLETLPDALRVLYNLPPLGKH